MWGVVRTRVESLYDHQEREGQKRHFSRTRLGCDGGHLRVWPEGWVVPSGGNMHVCVYLCAVPVSENYSFVLQIQTLAHLCLFFFCFCCCVLLERLCCARETQVDAFARWRRDGHFRRHVCTNMYASARVPHDTVCGRMECHETNVGAHSRVCALLACYWLILGVDGECV